MSEYIRKDKAIKALWFNPSYADPLNVLTQARDVIENIIPEDVRPNIHGHWVRMSDLPEDKDDRYKCSRCGNVVHHASGVNLYTFNSWCGACGSLNNSLIEGLEPVGEKGTE